MISALASKGNRGEEDRQVVRQLWTDLPKEGNVSLTSDLLEIDEVPRGAQPRPMAHTHSTNYVPALIPEAYRCGPSCNSNGHLLGFVVPARPKLVGPSSHYFNVDTGQMDIR